MQIIFKGGDVYATRFSYIFIVDFDLKLREESA